MSLAFELEPALETSLEELYTGALKGQAAWLSVGNLSIKLVGPDLPLSDSPDVSPPSRTALDLAAKVLEPWALQYNLADPWCVGWIIDKKLLDRWATERGAAGVTHNMWFGPAPLEPAAFAPTVLWQPDNEPRAKFMRRALVQFRDELSTFCDEVEARALEAGYVRIPERGRIEEHLNWLVRCQVKCEKPAEIWKSYKRDPRSRRAFEKAIEQTAELIGLTRRE
jgi:hypothetical protein